jgi:transposase
MSGKERVRMVRMARVEKGEMTIKEAAKVVGMSYRQCRRVYKRYREEGDRGLIHRSRGQRSNRSKPVEVREAAIRLYEEHYWDFGPTLASEKLKERDGYEIDHETLRRWLKEAGVWRKRRKRPRHRKQRERKAHFGELVQLDGSHHQWFEERGGKACLMDMVDDATGTTLGLMSEEETTVAAMEVLWAWVEKYGIPKAIYVDRKTVYITQREPTMEEQLAGEEALTQFGKACQKLGIETVAANSPQAKGRVERRHGVYQDRWVKELRLAGIQRIEEANQYLPGFGNSLNAKFAVKAQSTPDYHRPVPEDLDLRSVFCIEETRTIGNDWVVRYKNRFFQILPQSNLPPARKKVAVREYLDASIHMVYRGKEVLHEEIEKRREISESANVEIPQSESKQKHIPSSDHPWRRFNPGYFSRREPALV